MYKKRCTKCGKVKQAKNFPKVVKMNDGLDSWCRECHREQERAAYKIKAQTICAKEKQKRIANPQRAKAHDLFKSAVRGGHIIRQTICAREDETCYGGIEAHHWHGYDEAHIFDVVWLCRSHHQRLHRNERQLNESIG